MGNRWASDEPGGSGPISCTAGNGPLTVLQQGFNRVQERGALGGQWERPLLVPGFQGKHLQGQQLRVHDLAGQAGQIDQIMNAGGLTQPGTSPAPAAPALQSTRPPRATSPSTCQREPLSRSASALPTTTRSTPTPMRPMASRQRAQQRAFCSGSSWGCCRITARSRSAPGPHAPPPGPGPDPNGVRWLAAAHGGPARTSPGGEKAPPTKPINPT